MNIERKDVAEFWKWEEKEVKTTKEHLQWKMPGGRGAGKQTLPECNSLINREERRSESREEESMWLLLIKF